MPNAWNAGLPWVAASSSDESCLRTSKPRAPSRAPGPQRAAREVRARPSSRNIAKKSSMLAASAERPRSSSSSSRASSAAEPDPVEHLAARSRDDQAGDRDASRAARRR